MSTDFILATGADAVSLRGVAPRSDQYRWLARRHPQALSGRSDSLPGPDGIVRLGELFDAIAHVGFNRVVLPVDWARVEPFSGKPDQEELEFLALMFEAADQRGLRIWASLFDTSLPGWFADDSDGFTAADGVSVHWARHVDFMGECFDDSLEGWIPFRDPIGWALTSHLLGSLPPGRRDEETARDVVVGALRAKFEAIRLLASGGSRVAASFSAPRFEPHLTGAAEDTQAHAHTERWNRTWIDSWTNGCNEGYIDLPWRAKLDFRAEFDAIDLVSVDPTRRFLVGADGALTMQDPEPDRTRQITEQLERVAEQARDTELLFAHNDGGQPDAEAHAEVYEGLTSMITRAVSDGLPLTGACFGPPTDVFDPSTQAPLTGLFDQQLNPRPGTAELVRLV